MIRMSRAGRKRLLLKAIVEHDKRYHNGALTTAQAAHQAGLMSSTNVVNMLRELADAQEIVECYIGPSYQCGYTIRAWRVARWVNQPPPDRFINIGGVSVNWNTGEVKENVAI